MSIRASYFRGKKIFFCFLTLVILFLQTDSLKAYSNKQTGNSFFVIADSEGKDFVYYRIETFLYRIESLVYQTLGQSLILRNCRVYLKEDLNKLIDCYQSNKGNWKIYLKKDYLEIINNKNISVELFGILITSILNVIYSKENINSINWYISALNRKLYRILEPEIYPENASFTAINSLLINGYKLEPEKIINDLSTPNDKVVYNFNSEADEVLLNAILSMKNWKDFLKRFLIKSCANKNYDDNINIFYSTLSKFLKLNIKETKRYFIERLNIIAEKYALTMFMPASYYYIQMAFNKACIFTYTPKNGTETKIKSNLEDLPEIYIEVEPDYFDKIKQDLTAKFVKLQRITPFLIQKPINGIIRILNDFNPKQKDNSFKQKILTYKLEFEEALKKEKEVYDFLKEKELKHVRIPVRYYYYFEIIDTDNDFYKKIWPDLNNYLTLEYKY